MNNNNPNAYKDSNGLTYTELVKQEYSGNNCIISAGFVEGKNKPSVDDRLIFLNERACPAWSNDTKDYFC